MAFRGRRPSPKQQRELDAKMHQTLRSLMLPHYEREESARRSAFLEAQRILAGKENHSQNHYIVPKEEVVSEDDLDLECDLELEPRKEHMDNEPLPSSSQTKPSPYRRAQDRTRSEVSRSAEVPQRVGEVLEVEDDNEASEVPRSAEVPQNFGEVLEVEDDNEACDDDEPLFNNELTAEQKLQLSEGRSAIESRATAYHPEIQFDVDAEVTLEQLKTCDDDEPLFDNELTAEQKLQLSEDRSAIESRATAYYPEIQFDVDEEVTLEQLKTLSLDDVCTRMAYCAHCASVGGDTKHSASWYTGLMKRCLEAVATHEYPRPHLPFEVERLLDDYCDKIAEEHRAEIERNAVKLERRSVGCTTTIFECVYPVSAEVMSNNKVLLTGVCGDADAFFKLYLQNVHIKQRKQCYKNCICLSVSYLDPNVLHFAAAYGNAQFIKKVLFPEDSLPEDQPLRDHYKAKIYHYLVVEFVDDINSIQTMIDGWLCAAISADYKDCARELLGSVECAKMLQERKVGMSTPRCSMTYKEYIESPLSLAVYHGNSEMIKMLHSWQLIQDQHFPQAFREAANAGDVQMLIELYELCKRNLNLVVEQNPERSQQTPLHVAAAAGHLRAVQYMCTWGESLRTKPDAAGDLPVTYAIENGHMVREFWSK
ncbi:unnamed protein product [Strongylus vulgaris]|uniref:Uncharacterized protein n=1 Tax=Strongylus vulgaris TaxID=40348 RepID=A0A3P7JFD5_STRVU|nr:unnamed protein product [Strongylus vulgaris]